MRTNARPIGWGWSIRALAGFIGLALAYSSTSPALHAQAGTQGQWTTLATTMPINPVHVALMNNGKVLIVSGSGNVATETNFRSAVLDPVSQNVTITSSQPWDMFCNGMVVLYDGRPFINGGNLKYDPFWGQPKNAVFNPATGVFTDVQNMAKGRWYPTVTTLGDGRVLTFSGLDETSSTNTTMEIYKVGTGWSAPYSAGWTPPLYPRMHLLPDGNVLYSGSGTKSMILNISNMTWSGVGNTNSLMFDTMKQLWTGGANTKSSITRTYGTSVLLPLRPADQYAARVMIMGGGNPSIATTEILDTSVQPLQWQSGPSMSQPRIEMNATILPNGKVLATGGSLKDEDTSVGSASLNADLYDPSTKAFSSAGANVYPRVYHSNALLLPDATVLLLGGNPQRGSYEQHMEVYSPAYLFNGDGTSAARPTITSISPGPLSYGSTFDIQTSDAADISQVVLIRPGAPTHAFDMEQRLVELTFTKGPGVLTATAPPKGNIAPPGYYMLFILNSAGVPSVASFVQLPPLVNQAPAITSGNTTAFTVGAAGSFTVTTTGLPTPALSESGALPGGVTFVNNGNGTATLSGTPAAGTAGTYAITITATNGVTPAATQPFTLTVNAAANQAPTATIATPASNMTINPGDPVSFSGSGSDSDGTIASYAWTFAGGSPVSSNVAAPGNVTYATPGTYQASLKVTDNGGLSSTAATRTITVADFTVGATPSSGSTQQGGSVPYTVTVTGGSGFTAAVGLTVVSGLPNGANASFSPTSVTKSGSSTLTVTTSSTTPAGSYTLTIGATSGPISHTATVTLVVTVAGDFSINVTPNSQTIQNGNSATYTVTIVPASGFTSAVSLSVTTPAKFVTSSFSPGSITPGTSSTLTLSTKKQTKAGPYTVTVTGTSGTLVRSFDVTLVVQ